MTVATEGSPERLRAAIEASGLSIREVARRTGYDATHVSRMLSGKRMLRRHHVITIALALGLDHTEFLLPPDGEDS